MSMQHLLLVDDEEAIVYVFRKYLERAGYAVSSANSGLDAIPIFESERIDAVVTDLRMPGLSGEGLITRLRSARPSLPAVIVTAYAGECKLHLAGVPVLNKPVSPDELVAAVQRVLA